MKSTFGKLLIVVVIAVTAAVVIPVTANAATEKKGDYTVSKDGEATKTYNGHGTEFLNFDTVKTYANGTTRKEKFKYYLKSANSYHGIPGLGNTNVLGANCETMVPQGICMMDNWVVISAYDSENIYNSVIYIVGEKGLKATIVLPDKIHAGGLIYDGKVLWITNGKTDYSDGTAATNDRSVYYFSKEQIEGAVYFCYGTNCKSARIDIRSQKKLIDIDAAYCTYYEGRLWFGNFNSEGTSVIYAYNVSYDSHNVPKLVKVGDLEAPRASQGIAFYRHAGQTYLVVSTSYRRNEGKNFTNKLIVYKPTDYDKWNNSGASYYDYHKGARLKDLTVPYMSENVYIKSTLMYIIFESGAYKYDGRGDEDNSTPKNIICDKYCELDFYKVAVE